MCSLLNEQSRVLNGDAKLTDTSTELCAADINEGSLIEPVPYSLHAIGSEIERAIVIRSRGLDANMAGRKHICNTILSSCSFMTTSLLRN